MVGVECDADAVVDGEDEGLVALPPVLDNRDVGRRPPRCHEHPLPLRRRHWIPRLAPLHLGFAGDGIGPEGCARVVPVGGDYKVRKAEAEGLGCHRAELSISIGCSPAAPSTVPESDRNTFF